MVHVVRGNEADGGSVVSRYASKTSVPVDRSRMELERTLERYGCEAFGYLQKQGSHSIQFEYGGRVIRLGVEAGETPQQSRQRWRVLLLWVKATLESIEVGLQDFETAFALHTALPNGETLAEKIVPELHRLSEGGELPLLTG